MKTKSSQSRPKLLFDREDYDLVDLVNSFLSQRKRPKHLKKLFDPYLHPHGIKELAASSEQRIAWAVLHLVDTLEVGHAEDRLLALRALRAEVLHGTSGPLRRNTARVLLEIMKQIVREHGRYWRQVELAHDFFAATSGRPAVIRRQLRKVHLLEMDERWNQVAFDHHVHDANTKGRKAPTHLIMDAWIKGIRRLTVIYYNFVRPEAYAELAAAAEIMEVDIRAGVELSASFRGRYVCFIWSPRGFTDWRHFRSYLDKPAVRAFLAEGEDVSRLHKAHVLALVQEFNERHLCSFNETYRLDLPPVDPQAFMEFVGIGQASAEHLAEYIYGQACEQMHGGIDELRERHAEATTVERQEIEDAVQRQNALLPGTIMEMYLSPEATPDLPDPKVPSAELGIPELLKLTPRQLFERLDQLGSGYRVTLNATDLTPADVVELVYEAEGRLTHLEVFNLKDYRQGKTEHTEAIAEVRRTLNQGSPIACKRMLEDIAEVLKASDDPQRAGQAAKLTAILADLPSLLSRLEGRPIRSRIGSDSVGRSRELYGMGLAVRSTLPRRAQREFARHPGTRETIPVRTDALRHTVWAPRRSALWSMDLWYHLARRTPGLRTLGFELEESYEVQQNATRTEPNGNIITLGGYEAEPGNDLSLKPIAAHDDRPRWRWRFLNSRWKDALKVLIGFVPAFLTFYLTKDWWLLAYFGALIWFGITGVRNVVQSIVGGGGLVRSKLLSWNDLVSWQRVADSLLYTGFSVPLLDWLVKSTLLDRGLGITTATSPVLLYTLLALANGLYLYSHNTFRGLPRVAAIGNFFRSVLSIPIAIAFNTALLKLLLASGMHDVAANLMLQTWAAVIGKAASDVVAGVIEGMADRSANVRMRQRDYGRKIRQILDTHGRLEVLFPEHNALEMLDSPKRLMKAVGQEADHLRTRLVINALDLMYFWMYQPRARHVLRKLLPTLPADEQRILLRSQHLLTRKKLVSEMFLDDIVGKSFDRPLAFYLDKHRGYLRDITELEQEHDALARAAGA